MQTMQPGTTLQGGKYRIKKVLGQGGFGITYLAVQEMLDRQVAIKEFFFKEYCGRDEQTCHVTLGTQSNKETVERFLQKFIKEARTISKLHHPGIIEIHDIFMENNTAYYVMEYIEGESLGDIVKSRGALPEKEALRYIRETADALDYIHSRNINHLDIKPNNLMLRSRDSKIVVIDFGVSKQYDENTNESTTTTPVGISHGYSPVEQYKKNGVSSFSPQSDIYSLGATLYKLLTGVTPPEAIEVAQMNGILPMDASISANTKNAITKALQFRKENRPQTVSDFLAIIDASDNSLMPEVNDEDVETTRIVAEPTSDISQPNNNAVTTPSDANNRSWPFKKLAIFSSCIIIGIVVGCVIKLNNNNIDNDTNNKDSVVVVEEVVEAYAPFSGKVTDCPIWSDCGDSISAVLSYWTGEVKDDVPNGIGKIKYLESDKDGRYTYEGKVVKGIREDSNATLSYRNGNSYTGSFENDNFKQGRLTLKNDGVYFEGSFKDNQPWNGKWYFIQDNSIYSSVVNGKEKTN